MGKELQSTRDVLQSYAGGDPGSGDNFASWSPPWS